MDFYVTFLPLLTHGLKTEKCQPGGHYSYIKHLDVVQRHKEHFLEINMFILKLMQIIEIIAEDVKELLWTKKKHKKK